jgi:hypothetical protein
MTERSSKAIGWFDASRAIAPYAGGEMLAVTAKASSNLTVIVKPLKYKRMGCGLMSILSWAD